jgi:hypothetical protein
LKGRLYTAVRTSSSSASIKSVIYRELLQNSVGTLKLLRLKGKNGLGSLCRALKLHRNAI